MKIYGAIRTVIYWALTALVFVFISSLAHYEVLRYFIGGLMIFYGVEEVIYTVFKNKRHFSIRTLYWNIIEIVIGLTLIIFVETGESDEVAYAVVCVGWAIWSIMRETRELIEVTEELKERKPLFCKVVAILNILESLTIIALSLTMLIEPGEHHAKIHLYLLSIELFTKVLFPIINYAAERLEEKKKLKAADSQCETEDGGVTAAEEVQVPQEAPDTDAAEENKETEG